MNPLYPEHGDMLPKRSIELTTAEAFLVVKCLEQTGRELKSYSLRHARRPSEHPKEARELSEECFKLAERIQKGGIR